MTASVASEATPVPAEGPLPAAERRTLLGYAGLVMLLATFAAPNGGLIGIPVVFFLKNKLHLPAHELAWFNVWVGIPLYLSFAFGLLRDRWSPFGHGDRGHLVIFGLATAALYAIIAFITPTYALLFIGLMLVTIAIQTVLSSACGLFSEIGQKHLMPGQASAVLNLSATIPVFSGYLIGGLLSEALEGRQAGAAAQMLFLVGAGLMAATALFGALGPRRLFSAHVARRTTTFAGDVTRLVRCWPVYPPLILLMLWDFAPAMGTVLQYHLANALHATDVQVGAFYAIFWGLYLPSFLAYGWLCQRVRLSRLLFWSTVVAVPQAMPLLIVHTAAGALFAAIPMGAMGGMASAALIDLAIRSCPKGLQGTMMMLANTSAFYVALRFGDLWGTELYEHKGGFVTAVIANTAVYALMLPVLLLVPRRLSRTADGEPIETGAAV